MSKLYTFGDSFTEGLGCRPGDEYYELYHTIDNKTWPEIVSNAYNLELINLGHGGCSNEMIIDSILNEWDNINKDDIVIISKTYSHRFDIPAFPSKNKLITVWGPSWFDFPLIKNWPGLDILKNYLTLFRFDTSLYDTRHYNYLNFIKTQLEITKGANVVFWETDKNIKNLETITTATNGKIVDGHFSYQAHYDFSKWIINKIESIKHTKVDWI